MVLRAVTLCSFVDGCQFFRQICCLHDQLTTPKTIILNLTQVSRLTTTVHSQWCRRVCMHQDNALICFKQSAPWLFFLYFLFMQLESHTHFLDNICTLNFILLRSFVRYINCFPVSPQLLSGQQHSLILLLQMCFPFAHIRNSPRMFLYGMRLSVPFES